MHFLKCQIYLHYILHFRHLANTPVQSNAAYILYTIHPVIFYDPGGILLWY
uniref:Uncharacterized protein n=1 Tax=Anguilla anguilla TaxID=7936 RepID=A0A0E9V8J7_ANGAN